MIQSTLNRVFAAALALSLFSIASAAPSAAQDGASPDVVLVTLEAVRTDRLGAYGREESKTARLDGLAGESVTFERAYSHAPIVLPAAAGVHTGLTPLGHGLHEDARLALGPEPPTLAESFAAAGYRTGAFQGSLELSTPFGLARGFEFFDDEMGPPLDIKALPRERRARFVVGAALEWLAKDDDRPSFVWLHFPDARLPYDPPANLRDEPDPYDGELMAIDAELGRLLDGLGGLDDKLVVVVGTMGEALGDHGETAHGLTIQESTVHVPLIIRPPGGKAVAARVSMPVGQSDVMPTILELAGLPAPTRADPLAPFIGRSLAALVDGTGELEERPVYIESELGARRLGWSTLRGLVSGNSKLVVGPTTNLYDIDIDPREEQDLAAEHEQLADALRAELQALLDASARVQLGTTEVKDPVVRRMAVVGQEIPDALHGSPPPEATGMDPRANTEAWNNYHDAFLTAWSGSPHLLYEPFSRALMANDETAMLHTLLGIACERTRRFDEAVTHLERAIELDPRMALAYYHLGRNYTTLREPGESESNYMLAIEVDPDFELALRALGRRMAETGRIAEAKPYFRALAELRPNDRMVWRALVEIEREVGDWAGLLTALEGSVAGFPEDIYLRNYRAWVLAAAPDAEVRDAKRAVTLAESLVEESSRADPGLLDTLAVALASAGRFDEAVNVGAEGIRIANQLEVQPLLDDMRKRLALYQAQTPYLEN